MAYVNGEWVREEDMPGYTNTQLSDQGNSGVVNWKPGQQPQPAGTAPPANPNQNQGDIWNEMSRRDPNFNPRDAMIARDAGGWEQQLRAAGGSLYDPSDLEGVKRQVSYAQNAGKDPGQFINEAIEQYNRRRSNAPAPPPSAAPTGPSLGGPGGPSGGGMNTMQAWSGGVGSGVMSDTQQKGDNLYNILLGRANQGLNVDRFNPVIKAQSDAFRANQERGTRNFLSDMAEQGGPYRNLTGQARIANERAGQASGTFEAELMGRELMAKREEIAQALSGMGGLLTSNQQMALQAQLAQMDNALRQFQLQSGNDQFAQQLGFNYWNSDNNNSLRRLKL